MNILTWFNNLIHPRPIKLAIVRRYADANGSYVGELYLEQKNKHFTGYTMIGASLDTLPLDLGVEQTTVFALDTKNDFLVPMPSMTLRVGALDPRDNKNVQRMVRKLPRYRMTLVVQNRFIERVLGEHENY